MYVLYVHKLTLILILNVFNTVISNCSLTCGDSGVKTQAAIFLSQGVTAAHRSVHHNPQRPDGGWLCLIFEVRKIFRRAGKSCSLKRKRYSVQISIFTNLFLASIGANRNGNTKSRLTNELTLNATFGDFTAAKVYQLDPVRRRIDHVVVELDVTVEDTSVKTVLGREHRLVHQATRL